MEFLDLQNISSRKYTEEGYLMVDAYIGKAGIQDYMTDEFIDKWEEFPLAYRKNGIRFKVLRPNDEVFDEASIDSFKNKPITDSHPENFLDASIVKKYQIGFSKDNIIRDDDKLKGSLVILDKEAIKNIENGKNQISLGYRSDLVWGKGNDPNYGNYDAIMTNIKGNHIAIVSNGRAGSTVRLEDERKSKGGKKKMSIRVIDGISIDFGESTQALEAYDKLNASYDGKASEVKELEGSIEKKDIEIKDSKKKVDELEGEVTTLKAKLEDSDSIDKLVNERVDVIDRAKKLFKDVEVDGKSNTEIKTAVLVEKLKDKIDVKDKSVDFIDAAFDTLCTFVKDGDANDIADGLDKGGSVNIVDEAKKRFYENRNKAHEELTK